MNPDQKDVFTILKKASCAASEGESTTKRGRSTTLRCGGAAGQGESQAALMFCHFPRFSLSPPFCLHFFLLPDFLTHRGLVSGKRACAGKFQRFKSDQLPLTPTQSINFVQLFVLLSI